jgi:hypothetical protein
MFTNSSEIEPKVLKELIAAGSIASARIEGVQGGLAIILKVGLQDRTLGAARGGVRLFQSLDGAASVLQSYGIEKFTVNTSNWVPKTMSRSQQKEAATT